MTGLDFMLQTSVKLPDGTLVNVRGMEPQGFQGNLDYVIANAQRIAETSLALTAAFNAVKGGLTAPVQTQPAQPAQQGWGQQAQAPTPQPQQWGPPQGQQQYQQQQTAPQGGGQAPVCAHGPMSFKQGVSKQGRPYAGYYCTQRGSNCAPVYPTN